MKDIAAYRPEFIKNFAKIADKNYIQELNVNGMKFTKQNFIYEYLTSFLDNPNFDELKAFCEIKVDGKTPYCDLLYGLSKLPPERIKANLEHDKNLQKKANLFFRKFVRK